MYSMSSAWKSECTSVKKSVPEVWVKVRCTRGPRTVQLTDTLPRAGAVRSTNKDSFSPVGRGVIDSAGVMCPVSVNMSVFSLNIEK